MDQNDILSLLLLLLFSGVGGRSYVSGSSRSIPKGGNLGAGNRLRKINWSLRNLHPFKKDFYEPHPSVANRSTYEVDQYRRSKEVTVDGNVAPNPIQHFSETSFPDYVMEEIKRQGKSTIQSKLYCLDIPISLFITKKIFYVSTF